MGRAWDGGCAALRGGVYWRYTMEDDYMNGPVDDHLNNTYCKSFKDFAVAHLNVRSMNTGFDEFLYYMNTYQFDIIGLSETWLSPLDDYDSYSIPGYTFVRKDRNGRGGGVGFYIKNYIKFKQITLDISYPDLEYISITILLNHKKILLTNIYRSPSYDIENFFENLDDMLAVAVPSYDIVVFKGDWNIDLLSVSPAQRRLEALFNIYDLAQLITEPTRINLTTGNSSLIDVIVTNKNTPYLVTKSMPISQTLSDHNLIYFTLNLPKKQNNKRIIHYRDYKNIDFNEFHNDALRLDWDSIFYIGNIETKLEMLNSFILYLINKHVPYRHTKVKERNSAPWITDNVKLLMRLRDKAHSKYLKNRSPERLQYYRELRNFAKHAIIREKISYFNHFSRKNGQAFWKEAAQLNLTRNKLSHIPDDLCDPVLLNNYFSSCTRGLNNVSANKMIYYKSNTHPKVTNERKFSFNLITEEELLAIINKISTNAIGEDGISVKDLRLCLQYCTRPLINIINCCILEGYFPNIWKKAIIKPCAKVTNPMEPKDLRPISILPALSKILERHVYQQMFLYVNSKQIIPNCQSGFRPYFSTTTSLVNLLNDIRFNEDKNETTCLALLDFSKAFDTLNHDLLLAKLYYFGFSDQSVIFMEHFLKNRSHCVEIRKDFKSIKSNYIPLTKGVPQGSILGPLLFSLYVADIDKAIEYSKMQQYADDSQVYMPFPLNKLRTSLVYFNRDLNNIYNFCNDHSLKLNAQKSCFMLFNGNKNTEGILFDTFRPSIDNTFLPLVHEAKVLGVIFDKSLSFQSHINIKLKAAYIRLKKLYNLRNLLPSKTKYYLCNSLILSLFDYADVVYGDSLSAQYVRLIQKIQNCCMRFSFNIPFRNRITPYLNNSYILNMENRRKCHLYNFVYRIFKFGQPQYLREQFSVFLHPHDTRNINSFRVPQHRKAAFQKSFIFVAVHLWNSLSQEVKQLSPGKFSSYVKHQLINQQKNSNLT